MFTYMTHAAQASRGKGIQLLRQCVEDSSKRCKSKRYVCTANWSLKRASLLGNSLCRAWGSSEEFGRIIREHSCAFTVSSILRWFDALWSGGSRGEASPRALKSDIFTALVKTVLLCEKGLSRNSFVERDREICLPGCMLPRHLSPQMMQTCSTSRPAVSTAATGLVLETKHCVCSHWRRVWTCFPRCSAEMASLEGAKAD